MKKILQIVIYVLSIFALVYFVILMATIGPAFRFNYVWLVMGILLLSLALTLSFSKRGFDQIPKPIIFVIEGVVLTGCLLFVVVEGMIIRQSMKVPEKEADYLVVLGAKVNGTKPSRILKYRIEKAAEYLIEHPETRVVVSGGKGSDEDISEAEAMHEGLIEKGIEEDRIYMEDQSTSTKENLDFSKRYIEEDSGNLEKQNILIVTTDFHVLRAVQIAKKAGYQNVEGLAANSVWYLVPTNYVREFLALVKDKIVGNL